MRSLLVVTLLVVLAMRNVQAQAATARLCVFPEDKAAACSTVVAGVPGVRMTCVGAPNAQGCINLVTSGRAELIHLQGEEQYLAGTSAKLVPLVSEFYGSSVGTSYFAVAVVDKAFCDQGAGKLTMASLKGARSCHTGYRKTAGWTVPVGFMVAQGIMPVVNSNGAVQTDAQSVASFFSETCAPRVTSDGPLRGGAAWDGLCTACQGNCSETGPYGDYQGSLRCLMEGAGDVAFIKETTVQDFAKGGPKAEDWSVKAAADLRLLCPAGGCATVDMYDSCNLARVPAYAFMATPAFRASTAGQAVATALVSASKAPAFLAKAVGAGLLTKDTKELRPEASSFEEYFGASTLAAYASMRKLTTTASNAPSAAPSANTASVGPLDASSVLVPMAAPSGGGAKGGLNGGAVAGIVIGVLAAVALLAGGVWALRRRSARRSGFSAYDTSKGAIGKDFSAPV